MAKKSPSTTDKPLKVLGITIRRPLSVSAAARGVPPPLNLGVEVENPADKPVYVWAKHRGFTYDSDSRVLSVQLAEPAQAPNPKVKILADHPRTPVQVMVGAKSRATIKIVLAPNVPRVVPPSQPNGAVDIVPEPIGPIDEVHIRVQYAAEQIKYRRGEHPRDFKKRLLGHGDVVEATIKPTVE